MCLQDYSLLDFALKAELMKDWIGSYAEHTQYKAFSQKENVL